MSKRMSEREFWKEVRRVRAHIEALKAKHGGIFTWQGGTVRHHTLHPTKGWRMRRVERFDASLNHLVQLSTMDL